MNDKTGYNSGNINSNVLAIAETIPGREADVSGLIGIIPTPLLSGYLTVRGVNKMDNPTITKQGELFPEDSQFHSRHSLKLRHAARAAAVKDAGLARGRPTNDITGKRFGKLVAVEETGERFQGQGVWLCECDCGHTIKATGSHLKRKVSPLNHCGCLGVDKSGVSKPGSRGIGGQCSSIRVTSSNPQRAFSALLANYRNGAASRGYEWQLTDQQFLDLIRGDCHYCGVEPRQEYKSRNHKLLYNGVDRIDSSKPYVLNNCVSCCGDCNTAKMDRPVDEFLAWVEKVHKHQHGA